ncbi:MAG TPA: RES domain-containing protein [Vicinamibacterales bacterium]
MDGYRIGSGRFPLFDGAGAAASDTARWNSRGRRIIYAAEHYATALLETAAQLNSIRLPKGLVYIQITIPSGITIEEVEERDLPGWDADDRRVSQRFGDAWYDERRSLILIVPSLAAPGLERNILINQRHPQFKRLKPTRPQPISCHPKLLV